MFVHLSLWCLGWALGSDSASSWSIFITLIHISAISGKNHSILGNSIILEDRRGTPDKFATTSFRKKTWDVAKPGFFFQGLNKPLQLLQSWSQFGEITKYLLDLRWNWCAPLSFPYSVCLWIVDLDAELEKVREKNSGLWDEMLPKTI